jgi:hypothetical protein
MRNRAILTLYILCVSTHRSKTVHRPKTAGTSLDAANLARHFTGYMSG